MAIFFLRLRGTFSLVRCALSLCVMVSALRSFRFFALAIAEAKWFLCFIGNML